MKTLIGIFQYNCLKTILVILVVYHGFYSLQAQEIQIVNKVTLEPISDVLAFNNRLNFYETTNRDGKVTLVGFEPLDTVYISHQSFVMEAMQLNHLIANEYKVFLSQKVVLIDEVVITATKTNVIISDVSNQIEIISKNEINFRNPQNCADLLAQSGEVFVQKSQMGGGSPVLRGFEANKILLVIDGVRMNNAIYRSGHLQNAITIDPSVLERTEVIFGPGAVIYGTDAIGGVMHFITQNPLISKSKEASIIKFNGFTRYSSANNEKSISGTLNMGYNKWGSITSFSYSDFDDLRMGKNRGFSPPNWALSEYYIDRIEGKDTIVQNANHLIQHYSGYSQWNLLQKIRILTNDNLEIGLNFQASTTSNIPRYEVLNDITYDVDIPNEGVFNGAKFAEWYYGPQKRILSALSVSIKNKKIFDESKIIFAYQGIQESRVNRKYLKENLISNIENVHVVSLNGDFEKRMNLKNHFNYGFEFNYNHVNSQLKILNINTNETVESNEPTRYPDGGSNTQAYAFYLMNKWKPTEKIIINAGIRYSHFVMNSSFIDTNFIKLPEMNFHFSKGALSGSFGAVFKPIDGLELKLSGSSGFRSPNVDDYGKIRAINDEVTVPNLDLKPEYAYNLEIGLVKNFDNIARISLTGFYTLLTDAIVNTHIQINGSDSILYQEDSAYIITNGNIQNARVYGLSIGFDTDIGKYISMTANINYTKGKEHPSKEPFSHIPPLFGKVSLIAKLKRFQAETYVNFNAQKKLSEFSEDSEDRIDEATKGDGGIPGWFTLNLRTTAQLHKNLTLQFGIENIFDQHYKQFASGISSPGRNFVVTLRGKI